MFMIICRKLFATCVFSIGGGVFEQNEDDFYLYMFAVFSRHIYENKPEEAIKNFLNGVIFSIQKPTTLSLNWQPGAHMKQNAIGRPLPRFLPQNWIN